MNAKCIITAALTGGDTIPSQSPYIPITPKEIADEAVRCAEAGSAIVHVHARDPMTGQPTSRIEIFEEILTSIKERSDIVISITTGGAPGMTLEERLQVIPKFKPEIATFNMGSMNYCYHDVAERMVASGKQFRQDWERKALEDTHDHVFRNSFADLEYISKIMLEHDVKPEHELYDLGQIYNTAYLLQKGYLKPPVHVQFVLGVLGGARADLGELFYLKGIADSHLGGEGHGYTWSVAGVGFPNQFQLATLSVLMGGHIRVGLEDSLRIERKRQAKSNAEFVEKAVRIIRELYREPATPAEARQILGLKGKESVHY